MKITFESVSENEGFARVAVAAYMTRMNPTLEEIEDVKTAVSEAVTNAIIHGYEKKPGEIHIICEIKDDEFWVEIIDDGVGISDINEAIQPLFTTKPEMDRAGMGFVFMEAFMDEMKIVSFPNKGTRVKMMKRIGERGKEWTRQSL